MALAFASKASGLTTSGNPFSTASISTWTAGCRGVVFVSSACDNGTPGSLNSHEVSGGGVSWVAAGTVVYGSRRRISAFVSDGTPSTGALTITATANPGNYQESIYDVIEVTGFDTGTPYDTPGTNSTAGGTTLSCPDLGTLDAGDAALYGIGIEGGAVSATTGGTEITYTGGGGNVRTVVTAYDSADETPGFSWTGTESGGIVGVIWNVGAGATAHPVGPFVHPFYGPFRGPIL